MGIFHRGPIHSSATKEKVFRVEDSGRKAGQYLHQDGSAASAGTLEFLKRQAGFKKR